MNYKRIYDSIIDAARNRSKAFGFEQHHILPESLGGLDTSDNLVWLSTREHLVCHLLLARINPNSAPLVTAAWMMSHTRKGVKIKSSKVYASLRNSFIEQQSKKTSGKNNPRYGKTVSEDTRRKISKSNTGKIDSEEAKRKKSIARLGKIPGNKGKSPSLEIRQKISASITGDKNPIWGTHRSDDTKRKISESTKGRISPRKGVILSEETKQKLTQKARTRQMLICTVCGKSCTIQNLTRWHEQNCKGIK